MKILLSNTNYASRVVGGGQRSVQILAEALVRQGNRVVAVSVVPDQGVERKERNGVHHYEIGLANVYWPYGADAPPGYLKPVWHLLDAYNPIMAKRFARILDIEEPDLVHTNVMAGFSVAIWAEAKKRSIRLVHTLRDYYLMCVKSSMFRGGVECTSPCAECRAFSVNRKMASASVDGVVGISDFILRRHVDAGYFPNATTTAVIHNPLATASLPPTTPTEPGVRQLTLGYLGRLTQEKGVELLLEAMRSFAPEDVRLVVAGTGRAEYVAKLERQASGLPVSFIGFVEPQELFAQIDVLVVPSLWNEPLGRVVFEAYGHGIPVLASDRGGIPEMIEDGASGIVFDPSAPGELERVIVEVSNDPDALRGMRTRARAKASEFFPEATARRYLEVYDDVLVASAT